MHEEEEEGKDGEEGLLVMPRSISRALGRSFAGSSIGKLGHRPYPASGEGREAAQAPGRAHQPIWLVLVLLLHTFGCGKWPPIVESAKDIERLAISEQSVRARGLPDGDIPALARLTELSWLDFEGGWGVKPARITDSGIAELAKLHLPKLEMLHLGRNDKITDVGLGHVSHMRQLSLLSFNYCPQITDAGLAELLKMDSLTWVSLQGNPKITDEGIQQLAGKSNWEQIHLWDCASLTPAGVAQLRRALPNTLIDDAAPPDVWRKR